MRKTIAELGHSIRNSQSDTYTPIRRSTHNKFKWQNANINRLTITAPGSGCKSDSCVMCPLPRFKNKIFANEDIFQAIKMDIESSKEKIDMLSLYIDGSYYDQRELSIELREEIEKLILIHKIPIYNIETLPSKFPEEEIIKTKVVTKSLLLINVGIQTSNDDIRKYCIGSPFNGIHINRMMRIKKHLELRLRAYLLFKPPFLNEQEAMLDIENSIKYCIMNQYDIISVNPCKVARGTLLEHLYNHNFYSVPHYFSVAKALSGISERNSIRVEMPNSDGCPGEIAIPHICSICSGAWENGIINKSFNISPSCWVKHMETEHLTTRWQDRLDKFYESDAYKVIE